MFCLKRVTHVLLMEVEVLVLLVVVLLPVLIRVKPTGLMTSAEGDVLRYRFAKGQNEMLSRCRLVQVAFATKQVPKVFSDPKLIAYDPLTQGNRYAWHEIKVPVGTTSFRFDIHWNKEAQPSRTGPEVDEISLGKRRIAWSEMKCNHEVYEPLTVPCYWFRPQWFFNLDGFDFLKFILAYFVVVNALLLPFWFKYSRRKEL